jgi:replicative DNA helicase
VTAVLRIAGNLHLAELGADQGPRQSVSAVTVLKAARIAAYFKACAINAFVQMRADQGLADAAYLLDRIITLGAGVVSERDLFTACSRSRFPTKATMTPALNRLVDHGYLALQQTSRKTGGRPSSPRYRVHPHAAQAAQHAQGVSR